MAVYMITYDLKVKNKDEYQPLYEAIQGLGSNCHPVESVWFVDTMKSPNDIMNILRPLLSLEKKGGDDIIIRRCMNSGNGHYKTKDIDWMNSKERSW